MAKRRALEEGAGGISELPEPIIQHVLTFLAPAEVGQARLVSKSWLRAWRTSPTVSFREPRLHDDGPESSSLPDEGDEKRRRRERFLSFVDRVLLGYREENNGIRSFKLTMKLEDDAPTARMLDEWITIAAEKGLKSLELHFRLGVHLADLSHPLPGSVLGAKTLENLRLYGCKFGENNNVVMCRNLRRLSLSYVYLSYGVFDSIVSNCWSIEDLKINCCRGLEKIDVRNLEKLKNLFICYLREQSVEIEAPNVAFFRCEGKFLRGDPEGMPKQLVVKPITYGNLKVLMLDEVGITDLFFSNLSVKFPCLEFLKIRECSNLHRIKICSQSLKFLKLIENGGLKELQVDAPELLVFNFRGGVIPSNVMFSSAMRNWESTIFVSSSANETIDNSWFFKLKGFLTSLMHSEIALQISIGGSVNFVVDETRDGPANHGLHIGTLSLNPVRLDPASFSAFLDGCLWSVRPKIIKQVGTSDTTVKFTKFLHEMLMGSREQDDFNLQETKFWKKDLKEFKVLTSEPTHLDCKALDMVNHSSSLGPLARGLTCFMLEW